MNQRSIALLLRTLQLRSISETSTPDITSPTEWSAADLEGLLPLLVFEGAELWMYRRVQQSKLPIPDALKAELRAAVTRNSVINMRIDEQTASVTSLLSRNGIAFSLLKGQARRAAAKLYPFADARTVSDVDLLVPESEADRAWQLLCDNGFRRVVEGEVDWKADHHRPTLIDASNVAVELHTTTAMSVTPAEAWRRATENADRVEWNGLAVTVPNATELVWQALASGAADGAGGYRLKAFLSLASVLTVQPAIDWTVIARRLSADEVINNETEALINPQSLRRFLDVSATLAGVSVPSAVAPRVRANLGPLLLWRSQMLTSSMGRAARDRLLEESTRVETQLPLTPFVPRVGVLKNVRRRSASIAARLAYHVWRVRNHA